MIEKKIKYPLTALLLLAGLFVQSQATVDEYIETYKELAIYDMKKYGIPASIKLAQGILESASGNSELATRANNHFGIKCHKGWTGKTFIMDDDEKNECFRKYRSAEESYRDHSEFLTSRDRYASLFRLDVADYKGWAHGLKKAGYATNPRYPDLLIKIIEENELYLYDKGGVSRRAIAGIEPANGSPALVLGPEQLASSRVFSGKEPVDASPIGRPVYQNNGVKFVYAGDGDDFYSLAHEFNIYAWQLRKYNELQKSDEIGKGQVIYLGKKKRRAERAFPTHTVREGETLGYISQIYAVRLKRLHRINDLEKGGALRAGQVIELR